MTQFQSRLRRTPGAVPDRDSGVHQTTVRYIRPRCHLAWMRPPSRRLRPCSARAASVHGTFTGRAMAITAYMVDRDDRLRSPCVTARCSYETFLQLTEGADTNLEIQRKVIKGAKAYATLRSDLRKGCVLPPIVLAATLDLPGAEDAFWTNPDMARVSAELARVASNEVYIIDGLQRTNAIRQALSDLEGDERVKFLARPIRLEIWPNIPFGAIAYRMLLLNAGQRPMSVKHQVEVLSSKLLDDLSTIQGLEIFRSSDPRRRVQPGQFSLAKLAQAFQAWLQGQPNLDLRNTVMEELLAESAIEVLGHNVASNDQSQDDGFNKFARWLVELDQALGEANVQFLGNETVLLGIAAAVGALERSEVFSRRVWPALEIMLASAKKNGKSGIAIDTFDSLRHGIDSSKMNVGVATRDMVFSAIKEFIRDSGETPMEDCWKIGAARE